MKEADFLRYVLYVARRFGWRCWHVPTPMRASRSGGFVPAREAAGLCDLVLMHDDPPRLILAELKGDGGRLTVEQQEFLRLARGVAEDMLALMADDCYSVSGPTRPPLGVYVWAPGQEDEIETILRSKVLAA